MVLTSEGKAQEESITLELETTQPSSISNWTYNGIAISIAENTQASVKMCTDGAEGAIITWDDFRNGNFDIYVQRVDSKGNILWAPNGSAICTAVNGQGNPQICSDGAGGAIITWLDYRSVNDGIYAQRIDSNGNIQWTPNGTLIISSSGNLYDPRIISDGAGGVIITWVYNEVWVYCDIYAQRVDSDGSLNSGWPVSGVRMCNNQLLLLNSHQICSDEAGGAIITWEDEVTFEDGNIYAQRVNAMGDVQWGINGTGVCTNAGNQFDSQICSDGTGGVIVTWLYGGDKANVMAQRIGSAGNKMWTPYNIGVAICTADNPQRTPQICSDGSGGAIITWDDSRGPSRDIYAQRIASNGGTSWTYNGRPICDEIGWQMAPQICSDGSGGAIITWEDGRGLSGYDIYAQRVNSGGGSQWTTDGLIICMGGWNKDNLEICSDETGGAIIAWEDQRNGNWDIYAMRIRSTFPYSNNPGPITTFIDGSDIINWILSDDFGGGEYRVVVNDTYGNDYVWVDWTSWTSDISLDVQINRTELGIYYYTIEYYDNHGQIGIPNTITITILEDFIPFSNNPADIKTFIDGSEIINWILYDDFGEGEYRVVVNDTYGNDYVWVDWTSWHWGDPLNIAINRTKPEIYYYTIEYYDDRYQFGIPDTVMVTLEAREEPTQELPTQELPIPLIITIAVISSGAIVGLVIILWLRRRKRIG